MLRSIRIGLLALALVVVGLVNPAKAEVVSFSFVDTGSKELSIVFPPAGGRPRFPGSVSGHAAFAGEAFNSEEIYIQFFTDHVSNIGLTPEQRYPFSCFSFVSFGDCHGQGGYVLFFAFSPETGAYALSFGWEFVVGIFGGRGIIADVDGIAQLRLEVVTPIPATPFLFAGGLALLGLLARRRKKRAA